MIIEKKTVHDYENSYYTEYHIFTDYGFEKDIIEKFLAEMDKECKAALRKRTKGERNESQD